MIPLRIHSIAEAEEPFVARLGGSNAEGVAGTARLLAARGMEAVYAGEAGLFSLVGVPAQDLIGDVVLVEPASARADRLLRSGSAHNTLLVTERCDQLCVMCSQPPKKTHVDRFDVLTEACLLAEQDIVIGISGGEPTLYKDHLFTMIERVRGQRPDVAFHILSNGQHFEREDVDRLRQPLFGGVQWGIPLYSHNPEKHDDIVAKQGAHERLLESFTHLMVAGANVELRTVVLRQNFRDFPRLARFVAASLRFAESWSIMQLENIGFARNRWHELYVDHHTEFEPIAAAIDVAVAHGIDVRLFNFARCTVPPAYREFSVPSISDWKRKFVTSCERCGERAQCSGFFEWHPDDPEGVTPL